MDLGNAADWMPDSFFRTPAWRWARAHWLAEHRRRKCRAADDAWVERAVHYLAAQRKAKPGRAPAPPPAYDPAVEAALDLYRDTAPQRRWHVEALLLTAEPLEEVARLTGVPVETVEAYHQLLFDVRPRLQAKDWVMLRAIGTTGPQGYDGQRLGPLWKLVAYTGGRLALDVVIAVTTDRPFQDELRRAFGADAAFRQQRLRLMGKLTVAALTTESADALAALAEVREQVRRLDGQATGTRVRRTGLVPAVAEILPMTGGNTKQRGQATVTAPVRKQRTSVLGRKKKPRRPAPLASVLDILR
jgi:hypothetical protein